MIGFGSRWQLHMILSSTKLQMFVSTIKRKRSLINKLNNNRPKVDPCGTAQTKSYQSLSEECIFVRCLRFDKYSCIKFKPVLWMA